MPMPYSAQWPAMIAALRHPANASVTGLLSAVMKRPDAGIAQHRRVRCDIVSAPRPQQQALGLDDGIIEPGKRDAGFQGSEHTNLSVGFA